MEFISTPKESEIVVSNKKHYRGSKFWIRAKRRCNNQHMQITNECTEHEYHRLIKEVKKLLAPQQAYVYEQDFKQNKDSLLKMHEFQCSTMFLHLWCCASEFYFVDYDFHNCPFEEQVRYHLERGMLCTQSRHRSFDPDFFESTKQGEDAKFFYHLEVDTNQADT